MSQDTSSTVVPGEGWSNGVLEPQMFPVTQAGRLQLYSAQRRWIQLHSGWSRIGDGSALDARHSKSGQGAQLHQSPREQATAVRSLVAQLCEQFYRNGWATGTGGGISIRIGDGSNESPFRVFVAPSGIQKEDMIGDDVFELDMGRRVVVPPKTPNLKQSACTPLWYVVYRHRPSARAVIHTHSMHAQMATLLDEDAPSLKITHLEMLKGVGNHAFDDILEIPIIDNRPTEDLLADQLEQAIQAYPKCNAVLVRRHGLYVWGDSWEQAKTQCESFDYLFQSACLMRQMGIDPGHIPQTGTYRVGQDTGTTEEPASKKVRTTGFNGVAAVSNGVDLRSNLVPILPRDGKILLLDIEGCTTSISFVHDVLFLYVRQNLDDYLKNNPTPPELAQGLLQEATAVDPDHPPADQSVQGLVTYLMDRDVKSAALKNLQGQMWKAGYASGELQGHVYTDFLPTLQWCQRKGVEVYIYSSGSIGAQKLLFGNSKEGDLLPYLKGHFDIPTAGGKKEASSYLKIAQELHVNPSEIVFCTDSEAELLASKEAGVRGVMSVRPGNAKITPIGRRFPAIYSLLQICGED